ncbi:hypothetical protein [Actinomadura macrotermitis]|uniref:Carboxypeptidase regulatory-like domain-containing protein n=1 Tax=Actinomadura macrotermitis TaxID=2585200 RepID=A0A7K0C4E1_9ACTN|nr:hypothetical protein [Actinomadura macrotermitis]MQY08278.1 hypothetical protein [Actinomadura macrotermitis]
MNEQELVRQIRAAFQAIDPVPEGVLAAGRSALSWRVPGAGLAELAGEQDAPARPGVRGGRERTLTFTGPDVTVELEVADEAVTGRLTPPSPARLRVRDAVRGEVVTSADESGRFLLPGAAEGLVSLVFELPDASSVVTSWIRL